MLEHSAPMPRAPASLNVARPTRASVWPLGRNEAEGFSRSSLSCQLPQSQEAAIQMIPQAVLRLV